MIRRVIRPFWVMGIAALAVCLIGAWLPLSWLQYAILGLTFLLLGIVFIPYCRRVRAVPLVVVAVLLSCLWLAYCEAVRYQPLQELNGREVTVCATVDRRTEGVVLTTVSGDLPQGMRMWLVPEPSDTDLSEGDTVEAAFMLATDARVGLERLRYKALGVWLLATPIDTLGESWKIENSPPNVWQRIAALRDTFSYRVQSVLGGDVGAVVSGICFGADEALSSTAAEAFRRCGVSHLFAVSGLHLSILTVALSRLLKRLSVSRRTRGMITALAVIAFSLLVGLTSSVIRAGLLCLMVVVGDCFRRQADARNSLGLALVVLLANNPFAAYDVSLLLSFFATFGLLFWASSIKEQLIRLCPFKKILPLWRFVSETTAVTLAATAATLPVVVLFLGWVSLIGVISNLIMTLPASLLLLVGFVAVLLTSVPLLEWVYRPLLFLIGWLAKGLLVLAEWLSSYSAAMVSVSALYAVVWVLGSLLLVLFGWWLFRFRGVLLSVVCAVAVLAVSIPVQRTLLRDTVRFYALCEEELAVCVVSEDEAVLVTAPTTVNSLYVARAFLERQGIHSLTAVCVPQSSALLLEYIPLIFQDYITEDAVHTSSSGEMDIGSIGCVTWNNTQMVLTKEKYQLSFNAADVFSDVAFTADTVTLYNGDEPYVIRKQNGKTPAVWIREGELLIK